MKWKKYDALEYDEKETEDVENSGKNKGNCKLLKKGYKNIKLA